MLHIRGELKDGKLGITPAPMKPDEFGKFVRDQIATYRSIVRDAGIPQQ